MDVSKSYFEKGYNQVYMRHVSKILDFNFPVTMKAVLKAFVVK
jgi:hypothetical protein